MSSADAEQGILFFFHVLQMLISQRRLSREFADRLRCWNPSGFRVYCGPTVDPDDQPALERLSAYILRPSFAGTRLQYQAETGQIQYRTHKGLAHSMDALDWIALVTSHIPDPHQQMVRYYGRYSNASRGKRRQSGLTVSVPGDVDARLNRTHPPSVLPANGAAIGRGC